MAKTVLRLVLFPGSDGKVHATTTQMVYSWWRDEVERVGPFSSHGHHQCGRNNIYLPGSGDHRFVDYQGSHGDDRQPVNALPRTAQNISGDYRIHARADYGGLCIHCVVHGQ